MKRSLALVLIAVGVALLGFLVVSPFTRLADGGDFRLRMAEIDAVRQHVNPFDVWSGKVELKPYYPNTIRGTPPEGCTQMINAYVPWEYTYMYGFSRFSPHTGWVVYSLLLAGSVLAVLYVGYRWGLEADGSPLTAAAISSGAFALLSYALWSNACVGNFAALVLLAVAAMCVCLNRNWNVAAGCCWALAMVKPQLGLPLAVPLLLRGRLVTIAVASGICLAASVFPALACKTPLLQMLLQGPQANVEFFHGCGTWPYFLCGRLFASPDWDVIGGLLVGFAVIGWATWRLRNERNWLLLAMPAAVGAACWTYAQSYCHAMGWFLAMAVFIDLAHNRRDALGWLLLAMCVLSLSRFYLAIYGAYQFAGFRFPLSPFWHRNLDSLNSTVTLLILAAYVVWHGRRCGAVRKGWCR